MRLVGFGIYLGCGAMLHALFIGPTFDWASAWTFGWLFGWPIMLFIVGWAVVLVAACVLAGGWVCWLWVDMIANWRRRRRQRNS